MKFSNKLLLLIPFIFLLVGCPKDDAPTEEPARDYLEVYNEDIAEIEDFMDTHFMTVDADYNVTFTKITGSTPGTPISDHPDLTFKTVSKGGVDHKLYYIKLREGIGENPTKLDSVMTAYKGIVKEATTTNYNTFDTAQNPDWFRLQEVVQGWYEIFPEFKSGTSSTDIVTGLTTYSDYGAGVLFIPSALAYYNNPTGSIPAYAPLIFSFKLMKVKYRDHDGDKILSKDEYGGPMSGTALNTDGDSFPDYGDVDDDADGVITLNELKNYVPAIPKDAKGYYIYSGIPTCVTGGNTKKIHLDPLCNQ